MPYDELLTMSARVAAATGDTAYVDRYHHAVPKLDLAIADALAQSDDPRTAAALRSTEQANQALVLLEERGFSQLFAGDSAGASATLASADYARLKADYAQGMETVIQRLEDSVVERQAQGERNRLIAAVTSVAVIAILILLWTLTALGLRRSARARNGVEDQLRSQAHRDPLTGLANRLLLADRIGLASRRRDRGLIALFYADLDDFKVINDEHGHPAGDIVLIEVARRLQGCARPADTVARLGGDEFAMLVEGLMDAEEVADLARRFTVAMSAPIDLNGTSVSCGVSVGSVTLAESEIAPGPEALLGRADLAMYAAKRSRKGSWEPFEQSMYEDVLQAARLRAELREAFEHQQFALWYQPIADLRTGAMQGVEALVRWNHPERGVLEPDDFLPTVGILVPRSTPPVTFTVVVADDVDDERRLLRRALERSGSFTVVGEAADGLDAVRLTTTLNPQVVLLDLEMPGLDGVSALPLIMAAAPTTRVVILSGHVTEELRRRSKAAGAVNCLEKGFADIPATLLEILESVGYAA